MVTISHMQWDGEVWQVSSSVSINGNFWSSSHVLALPETATVDEIKEAILALYQ